MGLFAQKSRTEHTTFFFSSCRCRPKKVLFKSALFFAAAAVFTVEIHPHFFLLFFSPHYCFSPVFRFSFPFIVVATQIWGHIAGSPPTFPTYDGSCLHFYPEKTFHQPFLPTLTRVEFHHHLLNRCQVYLVCIC